MNDYTITVTRKLYPMRPNRPAMWRTEVETSDGQAMSIWGPYLDDATAIERAIDSGYLVAPEA